MKDISKLRAPESTMIRAMSFSSAVRIPCVYGWFSIICFATAVRVSVAQGVDLQAISHVVANCGQNVTLPCEANSPRQKIRYFAWLLLTNKICQYEAHQPDSEFLCESTDKTDSQILTLTLPNVMPVHQGNYLCKLRSLSGVKDATTVVTVQECFGSHDSSVNESHAMCRFNGVYPSGTIHWFEGDVNLTDFGPTQVEEDQHGRYNIWSTIKVQEGTQSLPYTCSLWVPAVKKYRHTYQVVRKEAQKSSGSTVCMQWIIMMLEIMMVKFMT